LAKRLAPISQRTAKEEQRSQNQQELQPIRFLWSEGVEAFYYQRLTEGQGLTVWIAYSGEERLPQRDYKVQA